MLCMTGNANTSQLKYYTVGIFTWGRGDNFVFFLLLLSGTICETLPVKTSMHRLSRCEIHVHSCYMTCQGYSISQGELLNLERPLSSSDAIHDTQKCVSFLKVPIVGIWHNSSLPIEMHWLALYLHFWMIHLVSTGMNRGLKPAYHHNLTHKTFCIATDFDSVKRLPCKINLLYSTI